ncbi:LysR substrate-binding domain-containing protein [Streptomyces sp. NPDC090106]|uniref:LysR substrate-binding domain-containing protein n=1 Tax=Streptomyces sp. NPDC090106 TaxID=3365946 RepID=UPI00380BA630
MGQGAGVRAELDGELVFATDGLEIIPLYEEPRVLMVPLGHRLAGRKSVTLDDIADETLPRFAGIDGGGANPPGHTRLGALVETLEDKLELVASDEVVSLAPAGFTTNLRQDIVSVPVSDALPVQVVLAARSGERHPLLAAFRSAAATHLLPPS